MLKAEVRINEEQEIREVWVEYGAANGRMGYLSGKGGSHGAPEGPKWPPRRAGLRKALPCVRAQTSKMISWAISSLLSFLPLIVNTPSLLKSASQLKLNTDSQLPNCFGLFSSYTPPTTGMACIWTNQKWFHSSSFQSFLAKCRVRNSYLFQTVWVLFPSSSHPSGSLEVLESRKVLVHCAEIQKRLLNCERKFAFQRHGRS